MSDEQKARSGWLADYNAIQMADADGVSVGVHCGGVSDGFHILGDMTRLIALALVLLAGPAVAYPDCSIFKKDTITCMSDGRAYSWPERGAENKLVEGSLPEGCTRGFDGSIVCNPVSAHVDNNPPAWVAWGTPPTDLNGRCEDGWVMVNVAARGTWWANDQGMTTVKKCVPAGDLKDPK